MADETPNNLYVHFPFCRRKCTYCVLHSRAGVSQADRDAYAQQLAQRIVATEGAEPFKTIYFGGGSPALCDLRPIFEALDVGDGTEFTVELHPLDVTDAMLKDLGGDPKEAKGRDEGK